MNDKSDEISHIHRLSINTHPASLYCHSKFATKPRAELAAIFSRLAWASRDEDILYGQDGLTGELLSCLLTKHRDKSSQRQPAAKTIAGLMDFK